MGLLDKLKNVFFEVEEEEIYVEEEQVKSAPPEKVTVAKKIETPEIRHREEKIIEEPKHIIEEKEEVIVEEPKEKEHRFPMNFDDKDFEVEKTIELEEPVKEVPKRPEPVIEEKPKHVHVEEIQEPVYYEEVKVEQPVVQEEKNTLYQGNKETGPYQGLYEGKEAREKKAFKPSPIISPIYGILNKNYTKDEIVTKKEIRLSQTSTKKADLDIVREKAYGDLAGEISASIEEDLLEEPKQEEEKVDIKEDLLYDLNDDESPTVKVVTVGDAEEYFTDLGLEYNVDYKVEKEETREEAKNENRINIEESNDDDKNLFDLIDSMYEDKE